MKYVPPTDVLQRLFAVQGVYVSATGKIGEGERRLLGVLRDGADAGGKVEIWSGDEKKVVLVSAERGGMFWPIACANGITVSVEGAGGVNVLFV